MRGWMVALATAASACSDKPNSQMDAATAPTDDAPPVDSSMPAADYSLDPTFGVTGTLTIDLGNAVGEPTIVPLENGRVFLAIPTTEANGSGFAGCQVLADGTLDPAFNAGACVRRDWWGRYRQAARDGDAILVAANRSVAGPRVYRLLADGSDDTTYGTEGYVELTSPSSIGSDPVVTRARRLSDGTHAVAGAGAFPSTGAWAQRVEAGTATPSPGTLVAPGGIVMDILDSSAGPAFVTWTRAARADCPPAPCSGDEVCRYGACVATPPSCATASCATGHYCDTFFAECLPDDIGVEGTSIIRTNLDVTTIESQARIGARIPRRAVPLADGRFLLLLDSPGMWRVSAADTLDRTFGTNGWSLPADFVLALAVLDDGSLAIANGDPAGGTATKLFTVTSSGQPLNPTDLWATAVETHARITDMILLPGPKLLTVGVSLDPTPYSVLVQRWIVH
jgi:hypothetical protein